MSIHITPPFTGLSPDKAESVSVGNSTATPLSGGATFTGTGEQNDYSHVLAYCIADQAGTLYFQWSNDGVSYYDFPSAGIKVAANIPRYYPAVKAGRYFRAKFVNGASAQSSFDLKIYYGENFVPSVSPLNSSISLADPSVLVRPTLPWLDISRGLTSNISVVKKFGRNASVGTSFVPVALGGIYRTPTSTSATTLRIKAGGNANDDAAGTGAREVTLEGLDENFELASEAVATCKGAGD